MINQVSLARAGKGQVAGVAHSGLKCYCSLRWSHAKYMTIKFCKMPVHWTLQQRKPEYRTVQKQHERGVPVCVHVHVSDTGDKTWLWKSLDELIALQLDPCCRTITLQAYIFFLKMDDWENNRCHLHLLIKCQQFNAVGWDTEDTKPRKTAFFLSARSLFNHNNITNEYE